MTMLRQHEQAEPCFITDGPPFNDMPIPPHRTMNLPQSCQASPMTSW